MNTPQLYLFWNTVRICDSLWPVHGEALVIVKAKAESLEVFRRPNTPGITLLTLQLFMVHVFWQIPKKMQRKRLKER